MKRQHRDRARGLRQSMTDAEHTLWYRLRNRQLQGCKFRRQHDIGPYIADFVCTEAMLVVELDGGQHAEQVLYDARRTAFLQAQGYRVLRFCDNDVLKGMTWHDMLTWFLVFTFHVIIIIDNNNRIRSCINNSNLLTTGP